MKLTEQQQRAVTAGAERICVDAGAGSGKTRVLVERIMHLLDEGVDISRIVAITFTRKAAAEMKERLRKAVHDRPSQDSPGEMTKWRDIEYRVDTARITTIDAFCAGLLRENALALGLDPDFAILADAEAALLRTESAASAMETLLDNHREEAHRLVVEFGLSAVVDFFDACLALPGTLDNAAERYRGLDAEGLCDRWREEAGAIERLRLTELRSEPYFGELASELRSFDGVCEKDGDKLEAVRRDAADAVATVLESGGTDSVREAFAKLACLELRGGSAKTWGGKETFSDLKRVLRELRDVAEDYRIEPVDPALEETGAQRTLDLLAVWDKVRAGYREARAARTALDFNDLLVMTLEMLDRHDHVRKRVARGIGHLLLDEFQDTNLAQLAMAERLIEVSGENNVKLFVVGDAKQSIYRFRGAEVEVFQKAKALAEEILPLDINFRSVPDILAFVNEFFDSSALLRRVEPKLNPLKPHRGALDGAPVEFLIAPTTRGADAREGREIEAELIADRVAALCGPGGATVRDDEGKPGRPAEFGDVAILFRKGANMDLYEEALRDCGIPADVVEGSGFYKRQEIVDIQNLLATVTDPGNEFALAGLLRSPIVGVSDDTLMALCERQPLGQAFWNGEIVPGAGENERLVWGRQLVDIVRARSEWPLPALLRYVLDVTGFEAILLGQLHGTQKGSNVRKLIDLAENFSHTGRARLRAFVDYLGILARRELREGEAELFAAQSGAVTLMTVHKSKGLEFPIVVLADAGAGPGGSRNARLCETHAQYGLAAVVRDARGETNEPILAQFLKHIHADEARAEEARVLYVAMTRARDRLLISGAPGSVSKGSWLKHLDRVFRVTEREHDSELNGCSWRGRVFRDGSGTGAKRNPHSTHAPKLPALDALQAQTRPLDHDEHAVKSLAVSALLRLMRAGGEASEETHSAARHGTLPPALRGEAAHRLMEVWKYSEPPPVDEVAKELCPALDLKPVCADALRAIAENVQRSDIWPRLVNAGSLERELPFVYAVDGIRINGKMDALADGNLLIDYKTGHMTNEQQTEYETQLQLYAAALEAITGRAPREALICHLETGGVHAVDVSPEAIQSTLDRVRRVLPKPVA